MASNNKKRVRKGGKRVFGIGRSKLDKYVTFEEMWAESGMVKIRGFDGITTSLTVVEAAKRALSVNSMLGSQNVPTNHRKRYLRFVDKAREVIFAAKGQLETPDSKKTELIGNVLKGRTAEGKAIPEITEEQRIVRIMMQFPCLDRDEIVTVMSEKGTDGATKMQMLGVVNQDRSMQRMAEAQAIMEKKARERALQAVAEIDGLGDS